jgi:peptide deformylase
MVSAMRDEDVIPDRDPSPLEVERPADDDDPRAPVDLSPERRRRRDAALARVRQWGDPLLRSRTVEVTAFDDRLRRQAEWMGALMDEAIGAGLAAPQAGSPQRLFVYRLSVEGPPRALVNPRVAWASQERQRGVEGCLSIPFVTVEVERAMAVTVVGQALDGSELTIEAEGPDAVVMQHEIDHLDGVLMLDRAERAERKRALRVLRERGV